MAGRSRWIRAEILALLALSAIILITFRKPMLSKAGKFMAPQVQEITEGVADAVILEGTAFVSNGLVAKGMELISSGKAKRLVVVLHRVSPSSWPFGMTEDYTSSVRNKLIGLGLRESAFRIIVTHIHEPITLIAAKGALKELSRDGVKSTFLVSPGFHMRRSYLVYQHLSAPLNIKIYPTACFDSYKLEEWWNQDYGPRDFLSESIKLAFYILRGHIPPTSLVLE
jgi:hypothetical protein